MCKSDLTSKMSDSEEESTGRDLLENFEETNDQGESFLADEDGDDYYTDEEEEKDMVEIRKKLFKVKTNNGYLIDKKNTSYRKNCCHLY